MQARLNESAVLLIRDMFENPNSNNKTNITILIICSINSVKLIAKNCSCPQSAPLKTSYIELKIKAGNKIKSISADELSEKIEVIADGKQITMSETIKQIIPVNINPEETIEPMPVLLFL